MGTLFLILKYIIIYGPTAISIIKEIIALIKKIRDPKEKQAAYEKLDRVAKEKTVSKGNKLVVLENFRDELIEKSKKA